MDLNAMKERFSLAYIEAVASQAGYHIVEPKVDYDSVDGTLMGDSRSRPRIDFQAKATSQTILRGSHLAFPLPIKNYDDLRANCRIPRILIVLLMPRDKRRWLSQSREELCMRQCAYWMSLDRQPPIRNSHSVTIEIPAANVFSSEQLADMMVKADKGDSL